MQKAEKNTYFIFYRKSIKIKKNKKLKKWLDSVF